MPRQNCFCLLLRWLSLGLCLLASTSVLHGQTTTFTGQVYSPLGPPVAGSSAVHGDPIPNILVFIADPNSPLPVFSQGVTVPTGSQTGCEAQPSLVPLTVLGSALTDPTGTFTFNVTGVLPATITVVIQAGKWRRQYQYPSSQFTVGGNNTLPTMSMPGSSAQGDLPKIAVVTGSADAIECIFPQIGIDPGEVTDTKAATPGSINLFSGQSSSGQIYSSSTPTETQLVNPSAANAIPLTNYDMVIMGCQGTSGENDPDTSSFANNVVNYADDGGRVFLGHWELSWMQHAAAWSSIADFDTRTGANPSVGTTTGQLSTSYSGEPTLAAWMKYINALDINAANLQFTLTKAFDNILGVNQPAQSWVSMPNVGNDSAQFSFDTPIGATGTPTASLGFTNSTANFLTGDPNDGVTITVTNTSATPTLADLKLTLSIPSVLNVLSLQDASGGSWNCTLGQPAVCDLPVPLAPGASDSVKLSFRIPLGTTLGVYSLVASLSGGGLNQSQQCGRVLYNDYHVETAIAKNTLWSNGSRCATGGALTAAQKFLEYSLYNLSNFVAPANTDNIQIQQSSNITWNPPSTIYYGNLLEPFETATVNTPGATTYTITPTASATPPDAATYTITANFSPTDSVDYLSSSASHNVTVLPDPTVAQITGLKQEIFYGQEIGYDPVTGDAQLSINVDQSVAGVPNIIVNQGTFQNTIDGVLVCYGPQGQPISGGSRPGACPDAGFLGWNVGVHSTLLTYSGSTDFASSKSPVYTVQIDPDPTSTTMAASLSKSHLNEAVTFTAQVADAYAAATGTVIFYTTTSPTTAVTATAQNTIPIPQGATPQGTATVNAQGNAQISLATLIPDTYNVTACFVSAVNTSGTYNYLDSCAASVPLTVSGPEPIPTQTVTFLVSSANPSLYGQPLSLKASVETTGAFVQAPTGTVTFYDGTTAIGNGTLAADGTYTLTTSSLSIGTHSLTVKYAGTSLMLASTSAVLSQVVVQSMPATKGFLLLVDPTTVPVYVGSGTLVKVQIVALTDFNQPVQLTCSGLPAESSCTFAQSTIPVGGGTTQMLVASSAPHDCNSSAAYFAGFNRGPLALLGLTALTLCFARRRRKLQGLALVTLLCLLPTTLTGCGTGNCTDFAVKPGDYNFTLTATPAGGDIGAKSQAMVMHVHL